MLSRLMRFIIVEPEVSLTVTAATASQMVCPGFCGPCVVPVVGTGVGGLVSRILRKRVKSDQTK